MPNTFSFEDAQKPLPAPGTFSFEEAQHPVDQGLAPSSFMSSLWGQLSDAAQAVPAEISRLGVTAGEAGRSLVGGLLNLSPRFPGDGIQELDQANIAAFRQNELDEQDNPGYQAQTTLGKVAQSVTHMAPAIGAALVAPEVAIPAFAAQGAWDAGKGAIDQGDSLANAQLKAGGQALLNSAVGEFIGGGANTLLSKIPVVGKVFVPTAVDTLGQAAARAVQGAGAMAVFKPAGTAVDYLSDRLTGEGDGKEYDWLPNAADLMTGALMAMPHAALEYAGEKSYHQEIADAINGTYLDNSDTNAQAVARLNPDSYDLNAVYPQDSGNLPIEEIAVSPALSNALIDDNPQPAAQQPVDWQQRASTLEQQLAQFQLAQLQIAKDKSIAAVQDEAAYHAADATGEASNGTNAAAVDNESEPESEPESASVPDAGMQGLRSAMDIAQQNVLSPADAAKVAILTKLRDQSPNPEAQARMQAQIDQVHAAEAPLVSRAVKDDAGSGAYSTRALPQKILDSMGFSKNLGDFSVVDPATLERGSSGKTGDIITRDNAQIIQWLGKKLGTNVHFFRQDPMSDPIDGVVNPLHKNDIFVNVEAGDVGWQYVVGHEFLHLMPDDLKNVFIGSIKKDVTAENYLKARRYVNQPELSENGQWEEIAADLMGNRFGEAKFWDRVLGRIDEPSLMQKLVDYLQKFLAKLGSVGKVPFYTDRYVDNLTRVRDEAVRVLQEHIARRCATEPLPETVSAGKHRKMDIDANLNAKDFISYPDEPVATRLPDVIIAHRGKIESLPVYATKKISLTDTRREFIEPRFLYKMIDSIRHIVAGKNVIIQPVITREKRQFTPHLIAAELSDQMGLQRGRDIVPSAISDSLSKTELNGLDRVFNRPMFKGKVQPGRNYFLVDEQLNDGGAFAALSSYIEDGGGHVIGALALTGKEYKTRLALTDRTLANLRQRHGEIEDQFSAKTGLSFDELTEAEARILANSLPQDAVKRRIIEPIPETVSNDRKPNSISRRRPEIDIDANLNAKDFISYPDEPVATRLPDVIIAHRGKVESLPVYATKKISLTDTRREFIEPRFLYKMIDSIRHIVAGKNVIIQPVITREKRQFTPHLIAAELSDQMGLQRGRNIVPSAMSDSLSKTELNGLDRVFNRPMFKGKVQPGRNYFLVDEQLNDGGAFAALSLYIEEGGGHVIGALALTGKEYKTRLALTDTTLANLRRRHGEIEDQFSAKTGLSFDELTEAEGRILANSRPQGAVKRRITEPMPERKSTTNGATQRGGLPFQGAGQGADPGAEQEATIQALSAAGHTIGRRRSGRPLPSSEEEARVRRTLDPAHFVFRGDARHPRVVFKFGFRTFGTGTDIMVHLTTNEISDFIATSKSPNVAHEYATNFDDGGYVYMVRGQLKGIDVNKVTGKLSPYPREREIAMPGGILPSDIIGARRVDSYGRFVGPFIRNPAYIPG